MAKIAEIDMIAKEIKYHHTCRRTYLNKAKAVTSKQNIDADNVSPHERAFSILKSHIEESLIEAEGAELLISLHSRYISKLPDENSSYPAASLRDKILQYFPEQLQQCKPSNRKGVIIYNNKLSEETVIRRDLFDHSLIVEVAFYLRGRVKEAEKHQDLPETLTPDLLLKRQGDPPQELQTFFKVLYTGSVKERESYDCAETEAISPRAQPLLFELKVPKGLIVVSIPEFIMESEYASLIKIYLDILPENLLKSGTVQEKKGKKFYRKFRGYINLLLNYDA